MNPMYLLAVFCQMLATTSQTLLKKSALKTYASRWREYLNPYVICGYGLLGLCMLLVLICYNRLGYMRTVMLEPLGYVFVLLVGVFYFREKMTVKKICGITLILIGIVVYHTA